MELAREEEDDLFFDAREEVSSLSDYSEEEEEEEESGLGGGSEEYGVWSDNPSSVDERRQKFRKWMGLSFNWKSFRKGGKTGGDCSKNNNLGFDVDRITVGSGAVLRTTCDVDSSTRVDTFELKVENFDTEMEPRGVLENQPLSSEELQQSRVPFPPNRLRLSGDLILNRLLVDGMNKLKMSWVRRKLGALADRRNGEAAGLKAVKGHEVASWTVSERVRVSTHGKRSKELSFIGGGQHFAAHQGSILTMKFSPDGRYLASGGEDGFVRVWRIIEDEMSFDPPEADPSCVYFRMDHVNGLVPLNLGDKKEDGAKKQKRPSSDATCVIFPSKVFKILEKPVHEFEGHSSDILDLSWSKKGLLLSSSADKTVRLWQLGSDRCQRVFYHNNYVTSVAFNPVDDNFFISGSLDGKIRVWEVPRYQVVCYNDIRDIVTAVCYRPDGNGGVVGSMTGNCYFYDIIDNKLQLDANVSLHGKKRSLGKRITSFEFSPSDAAKLVVTSADGLIRVLLGKNIVSKLKASRINRTSAQTCATFTQDGKHIISASEDSNIYVWNHMNQQASSRAKQVSSYESFQSHNVSVAIPWCGTGAFAAPVISPRHRPKTCGPDMETGLMNVAPSLPKCLPLRKVALDAFTRSSATWPEESLDTATPAVISPTTPRSDLKVLRSSCQNMMSSHLLGLVIVSAGWDGCIRTYHNYGLPVRH